MLMQPLYHKEAFIETINFIPEEYPTRKKDAHPKKEISRRIIRK